MDLTPFIRSIKDFPKPGVIFLDITPLLASPKAFGYAVDTLAERFADAGPDKVVAAEARGFLFGAPLALKLGVGYAPVRKKGKLPAATISVTYDLEYGTDTLFMHQDAVAPGEKVLIIDDVLATGGTMAGMLELMGKAQAQVAGVGFLIEIGFLKGKDKLRGVPYTALLQF
jgi:adenine phosphoribosyltransferase